MIKLLKYIFFLILVFSCEKKENRIVNKTTNECVNYRLYFSKNESFDGEILLDHIERGKTLYFNSSKQIETDRFNLIKIEDYKYMAYISLNGVNYDSILFKIYSDSLIQSYSEKEFHYKYIKDTCISDPKIFLMTSLSGLRKK